MSVMMKPTELISHLLSNATNLDVVKQLVAEDATYVSLNYNNPDLAAVSPSTIPTLLKLTDTDLKPDRTLVWHSHQSRPGSNLENLRRRQHLLESSPIRHLRHLQRFRVDR